jgi:hypothetical protein
MKQDVLDALSGNFPAKIPCKETLDHPGIIHHVSTRDDFDLNAAIHQARAANGAFRARFGNLAVMYDLYYTTLLTWPVVTFEWEP